MNNRIKKSISLFIILIGVAIFAYPSISTLWNDYVNSKIINKYNSNIKNIDVNQEILKANKYNQALNDSNNAQININNDKDIEYESLLKFNSEGVMGYIEIPKIAIRIPIYHYSDAGSLDLGIGHVLGSSLPIGGSSTHSLLTGHRGLPNNKLFTDLDKLKNGDCFYIYICGEKHKYIVKSITTVKPEELGTLKIEEDKDIITLVTCTPYAVNTHRLLISGERSFEEGSENITKVDYIINSVDNYQANSFYILIVLLLVLVIYKLRKKVKR